MDLFFKGGPLFMGLLSILALAAIVAMVLNGLGRVNIELVKELGYAALSLGIIGQLLGLYDAFRAIEIMGKVSPALIAGGLKVSSIPTLYGILILFITQAYRIGRSTIFSSTAQR